MRKSGISDDEDSNDNNMFSRVVDPHTNDHDVDIVAVNRLIHHRIHARTNKDFRSADIILNQLLSNHGVILNDSNKTWKTGTKKEIKKLKIQQQKVEKVAAVKKEVGGGRSSSNHNSNKYEYNLSPDAGPNSSTLSGEEIRSIIADRGSARRYQDFEKADMIRNQLKLAGVYIEDGLQEWRADGIPYDTIRGKLRNSNNNGGQYESSSSLSRTTTSSLVRSEHSLPFDNDGDEATVNELLVQRTRARSGKNYEQADSIRDRLYETYNIRIDDNLGKWSIGGNFGETDNDTISHWAKTSRNSEESLRYRKSEFSEEISATDQRFIQSKVDERMRAKRTRNYELSDTIRDDLFRNYDVTIHDKINEWSLGGDFGEDNSWKHVVVPQADDDHARESILRKKVLVAADVDQNSHQDVDASPPPPQQEEFPSQQEVFPSPLMTEEQLSCLTVVQLKEKLRASGLTVSGTKAKLINRLLLGS